MSAPGAVLFFLLSAVLSSFIVKSALYGSSLPVDMLSFTVSSMAGSTYP